MNTYFNIKNRILVLLEEKNLSIHALAIKSGVAPSTIKNILYGKSQKPRIVTLKMPCDGMDVTLSGFFDAPIFADLEQEIK